MIRLGVNIDHVATLRQARGGIEPEPIAAALNAENAGADQITVHLREDRRHIQDRDVRLLRQLVQTLLNLEMAAEEEIISIALDIKPDTVTLVPEKRKEITTEGGLDVYANKNHIKETVAKLKEAGMNVSLFIDPDEKQIRAARETEADAVELHTGRYAEARGKQKKIQLDILAGQAQKAADEGLTVVAGHGLNYFNVVPVAAIPEIEELNIGHSIVSRALFTGLHQAVRDMIDLIKRAS